jgi:hypothetical protein
LAGKGGRPHPRHPACAYARLLLHVHTDFILLASRKGKEVSGRGRFVRASVFEGELRKEWRFISHKWSAWFHSTCEEDGNALDEVGFVWIPIELEFGELSEFVIEVGDVIGHFTGGARVSDLLGNVDEFPCDFVKAPAGKAGGVETVGAGEEERGGVKRDFVGIRVVCAHIVIG